MSMSNEQTNLRDLIKSHTCVFAFIAEAMSLMASGDLVLKTRGLANTRELVRVFHWSKTR